MTDVSRRDAFTTLALGGAALASGLAVARGAGAQPRPPHGTRPPAAAAIPRTLAGAHAPVALPFAAGSLHGLSERLITSHHDNNYAGAVRNLNLVEQQLSQVTADTPPFLVAALRERELMFRNSVGLHEAYFANLGGNGHRDGAIEAAVTQAYGTSAVWEAQFRATALGLGGGSGWVVLGLELDSGAIRTCGATNHTQALACGVPLLVMDMYEHAYQLDFGAAHARYVDAFFANVKWDEVNRRLEHGRRALAAWRA